MPELPEVESISRSLHALVAGRRIAAAELRRARLAPHTTPEQFAEMLSGCTINFVHRRGKHILVDLSGGRTLIVHLRMSGRFSLLDSSCGDPKFAHAVFHFGDEQRLVFDDQRHFGLMKVVDTSDLYNAKELYKLAPEPFSEEFSQAYLLTTLRGSKRVLKEVLIDQTKVCGLGNIYACEAMFAAGVDPRRAAARLSKPSILRLHEHIRAVLAAAISHSSQLAPDPQNLEGSYFSGSGGAGWTVYDREGQPCLNCDAAIVRIKQGARSTYFCRRCQRH